MTDEFNVSRDKPKTDRLHFLRRQEHLRIFSKHLSIPDHLHHNPAPTHLLLSLDLGLGFFEAPRLEVNDLGDFHPPLQPAPAFISDRGSYGRRGNRGNSFCRCRKRGFRLNRGKNCRREGRRNRLRRSRKRGFRHARTGATGKRESAGDCERLGGLRRKGGGRVGRLWPNGDGRDREGRSGQRTKGLKRVEHVRDP